MNKNEKVRAVLASQYTVTLSPRLDADAGQLTIANKDAATLSAEDILAEVLMSDSSKTKTMTHNGSLYFKVTGTGTDNLVVSYRRKASDGIDEEMSSLFDSNTGM